MIKSIEYGDLFSKSSCYFKCSFKLIMINRALFFFMPHCYTKVLKTPSAPINVNEHCSAIGNVRTCEQYSWTSLIKSDNRTPACISKQTVWPRLFALALIIKSSRVHALNWRGSRGVHTHTHTHNVHSRLIRKRCEITLNFHLTVSHTGFPHSILPMREYSLFCVRNRPLPWRLKFLRNWRKAPRVT